MGNSAVFIFLGAGTVSMFSFLAVASWCSARLKERDSFYKNDMLKKMAENAGEGANAALAMLREENRIAALRRKASLREGGLVTASVGLAIMLFLRALIHNQPIYLCGLIVLLPGLALLASAYLLAPSQKQV